MSSKPDSNQLPFTIQDADLLHFDSYVDGDFVSSKSGARFDVTDPGSGTIWASCPDCSREDVDAAVQSSYKAFQCWSKTTPRHRAKVLLKWHELIVAAREDLARILVHETGKPLAEALGEIDYALTFTWWFVGEAERALGTTIQSAVPGRRALTIKQPVGVAAALVPWNFPIALSLRKAAAALAAGCTMVIKTSPETPLTAVSLAYLATKAGYPPGALNVLTTSLENTPAVAEELCLHPLIKKVSFTGSTRVGKIIQVLCARNLKTTTLELGGNCPFIVFDDANLDQALEQLMALKWRHAGQACVSSNRLYVQSGIHDTFVERLVTQTKKLRLGHGMQEGTTIGALTTTRNLGKGEELFEDAVGKGATVLLGTGRREQGDGFFMAPTILKDVTDTMLMTQEEVFAPVLGVCKFESEEEVTRRANDTTLGLASYVFTKNSDRLWRMLENLDAGMIGLNVGNSSSAEAPFGGINDSGHGKESGKDVALEEFLITKTDISAIAMALFGRQVWILTKKNLIITLQKRWISTPIRAFVIPLLLIILLSQARKLLSPPATYGLGSPQELRSLSQAIEENTSGKRDRIVFVSSHPESDDVEQVISSITNSISSSIVHVKRLDNESRIQTECQSSWDGLSRCFAVVVFHSSPGSGEAVGWNYTIRADGALGQTIHVDKTSNDGQKYTLPLQRAIDIAIGRTSSRPTSNNLQESVLEQPFTSMTDQERTDEQIATHMGTIIAALAVAFLIAMIGVVYHLTGVIAAERESGIAQLLDVMMPNSATWQPQTARLASHHISFIAIYGPGWLAMGVIAGVMAFPQTSIAIPVVSNLVCGLSLTSFAVLTGCCFKEAQMSGITAVIVSLAMGIVAQVARDAPTWVTAILALAFPPCNYVYLIIDIARWEKEIEAASLVGRPPGKGFTLPLVAFWCFAVVQTMLYPVLAAVIERLRFGTRSGTRKMMPSDSTFAVQLENFTKSYPASWTARVTAYFQKTEAPSVQAARDISLNVHRGEIYVLLGANGSGKSTTLDAVAGMHSASGGDILLSYSAHGGRFGHCPQKNVMWDDLTVQQHATIFDGLKRVNGTSSYDETMKLIEACDLSSKVSTPSRALSGGQKRKLQLLMMYAGDSTICCVDEVSSGLAILSHGSLKVQGTSAELKQRMTSGYRVHVRNRLDGPQLVYNDVLHTRHDDGVIYLPGSSAETGRFLARLERQGVMDYEVNGPTLEEVFLRVAEAGKEQDLAGGRKSQESNAPLVPGVHRKPTMQSRELLNGRPTGILEQFWVLWLKRFTLFRRNVVPFAVAVALPVIAAGVAASMLRETRTADCNPEIVGASQSDGAIPIVPSSMRLVMGPRESISGDTLERVLGGKPGSTTYVDTLDEFNNELEHRIGSLQPGGIFLGDEPTFAWRADESLAFGHASQNLLNSLLLNMTITSDFQALDTPSMGDTGDLLVFLAVFGLTASVYPAIFTLYPTFERLKGIRSMQYSNGATALPLWLSHLGFDFLITIMLASISVSIFLTMTSVLYELGYLFLVLILYGTAATLLSYILSLLARSQLGAFALAACIQAGAFLVLFVIYLATSTRGGSLSEGTALLNMFYGLGVISPSCSLARSLFIASNMFGATCRGRKIAQNPAAMDVYGGPIVYLTAQSLVYFLILVLNDSGISIAERFGILRDNSTPSQDDGNGAIELESGVRHRGSRRPSKCGLEVMHLTKKFKGHTAVDDVTFKAPKGECFALLGPNGAGKTTCISMIRGDTLPSTPESMIWVDGVNALKHRSRARAKIGVCPQIDPLDAMTVTEHLLFYARIRGVKTPRWNVNILLDSLGLREFSERQTDGLSGGNKRKLSLGIALIGNPRVLLLDEPSSGMDAASMRLMWRILSSVMPGRSLLLTTHSMEEADALATRAVVVAGRLLASGTTSELKLRYGDRYYVQLVHVDAPNTRDADMKDIKRWIESEFSGAKMGVNGASHGQMRFEIPKFGRSGPVFERLQTHLAHVFQRIEEQKASLGIRYYSVNGASLEQVFLGALDGHVS
ncbi:aldehyde dehydrogenase family protein [Sarocladium implicatum]|nr:aldehyde dehydrogenase family protein [Sarocladium implicatum]